MTQTHNCPIDNCNHQLPHGILMCHRHWYMVPAHLRHQVTRTWNATPFFPTEYVAARTEAIRSVNLLLGVSGGDRNG